MLFRSGEHLVAMLDHGHVILDADADALPAIGDGGLPLRHRQAVADVEAWLDGEQKRREQRATQRANGKEKDGGSWMSIFDAGDQAIQDTLGSARKPTPKR